MLSNIGIPDLILVLVIAQIIFGPSKLPEIGRAFGKTLTEFKSATKSLVSADDNEIGQETNVKKQSDPSAK